jgi:hypothetical protein
MIDPKLAAWAERARQDGDQPDPLFPVEDQVLEQDQLEPRPEEENVTTTEDPDVEQEALFPEPTRVALARDTRSTAQRRRDAQTEAIALGQHPLAVPLKTSIPLHPDADRETYSENGTPRCGSCVHRQQVAGGNRNFPKCVVADGSRAAHGESTDVARYWPGCTDWEPRDGAR